MCLSAVTGIDIVVSEVEVKLVGGRAAQLLLPKATLIDKLKAI
jgi:hypothetical protein